MIGKPNHARIFNGRPEQRMGLQHHSFDFDADPGCRWKNGATYFSEK
jgi:hypothetical protein